MRLSNMVPSVFADLVVALESIQIRTETDLLFSAPLADIHKRLPAATVSLQMLIELVELVTELCAASGQSSLDLLDLDEQCTAQGKELSCGNQGVDVLLRGLCGRKVIEISGDKGSGKTVRDF